MFRTYWRVIIDFSIQFFWPVAAECGRSKSPIPQGFRDSTCGLKVLIMLIFNLLKLLEDNILAFAHYVDRIQNLAIHPNNLREKIFPRKRVKGTVKLGTEGHLSHIQGKKMGYP